MSSNGQWIYTYRRYLSYLKSKLNTIKNNKYCIYTGLTFLIKNVSILLYKMARGSRINSDILKELSENANQYTQAAQAKKFRGENYTADIKGQCMHPFQSA